MTLMSPPLSLVTNRRPSAGDGRSGAGDAAGPAGASAEEQADDTAANSSRMARRMATTVILARVPCFGTITIILGGGSPLRTVACAS